MSAKKSVVEEMARLRLHQQCLRSCKTWGSSTFAIFLALFFAHISEEYSWYKYVLQLLLLLTALLSIGFVVFFGNQKTELNSKQMKLLGMSQSSFIDADQVKLLEEKNAALQKGKNGQTGQR